MTRSSLQSITPDSITGMIFALEGLKNVVVLLNGPMGCRFYHSTTSQFLSIRKKLRIPPENGGEPVQVDYNFLNDFFFRQERVPCTYLDGYDYVYSTREKVGKALDYIRANVAYDVIAIINSPGAALIGDNLLELAREKLGNSRAVMLESSGYSSTFEEGAGQAALALLQQVGAPLWEERQPRRDGTKKVNLLGLNIWQRYMEGDLRELKRLFALCGIEVNAALCAGSSLDELAGMPDADLNVVLYPEIALECAEYLREKFGTPYFVCESLPVGFTATEQMFGGICALLGTDDSLLRLESERARALAWYKIQTIYRSFGKPRGVRFCVEAGPSIQKAYTAFLRDYLAMEPSEPEESELVLSDANVISELMLKNKSFCGIEICQPGMGYIDLIPKTHMGLEGALFLIEQVLNGVMSKI